MKFILKIIFIAALSYAVELFLPWWSVVLSAFLIGILIPTSGFNSFLSGFLGVGLLWLIFSIAIYNRSDGILATRIAAIFQLNQPVLLVVVSSIIGGVVGGMGALTGSQFFRLFTKEEKKSLYN